jgi:hypothetical protein
MTATPAQRDRKRLGGAHDGVKLVVGQLDGHGKLRRLANRLAIAHCNAFVGLVFAPAADRAGVFF